MNSEKPVIHYIPEDDVIINVGRAAFVFPLDHPQCTNKYHVLTSTVLWHDKDTGEFETTNSIYVPAEKK